MLINNATHQRETLTEGPIRLPLKLYWPRYVVIGWSAFSLNVICCCFVSQKLHLSLKHSNIIVINTREEFFHHSQKNDYNKSYNPRYA